jgi:hypothetical protein
LSEEPFDEELFEESFEDLFDEELFEEQAAKTVMHNSAIMNEEINRFIFFRTPFIYYLYP